MWAGGFLIELALDRSLPLEVRRNAVSIARHFPTIEDISTMALLQHPFGPGAMLKSPEEVDPTIEGGRFGPLRHSTRLTWPEEA